MAEPRIKKNSLAKDPTIRVREYRVVLWVPLSAFGFRLSVEIPMGHEPCDGCADMGADMDLRWSPLMGPQDGQRGLRPKTAQEGPTRAPAAPKIARESLKRGWLIPGGVAHPRWGGSSQ
eukprot:3077546-Pyramimonas_sp.AAC.1